MIKVFESGEENCSKILEKRDNIQKICERDWLLFKKKRYLYRCTSSQYLSLHSTFKTCKRELDFMSSCPASVKVLSVK